MLLARLMGISIVSFGLGLAQTPVVTPGGVVDAASFEAVVSPGSLVSIFGSNLASQIAEAGGIHLPISLGGVSVKFNEITAPLLYVSPTQINAQLPWEVPSTGAVNVTVTSNGTQSAPQPVMVTSIAPGIFATRGYAIAIHSDGTLAAPGGAVPQVSSHSATPGETLILLGTGLGPVNPAGLTGNNSIDTLRTAVTTPMVFIGDIPAQVAFSGLSPEFVGVDQLNVVVPSDAPTGDAVPLVIQSGGRTSSGKTSIAVGGTSWTQWGQNEQHSSDVPVTGQALNHILANIVYDPLTDTEQADNSGELLAHYQVPLVDGNDVFMEFKSGVYTTTTFAGETWGENRYTWQNGQLVKVWSYSSDWRAPGTPHDFWEPVFHATLANGAVYVPGASGSVIKLNKATGALIQRFAPFGADPNTYVSGPITADTAGNLIYNVIQVAAANGFYVNDATDSWLVKVATDGSVSMVSYKKLTSPEAPPANGPCELSFTTAQLPWPPSPTAVPGTGTCGTQRAALNVAPAIAPDGTIYSVSRAHINSRYAFLVAIAPDLTKKWVASLRDRFQDGCGVPVSSGGWLPPNGSPGGCRAGAPLGVDPATNRPGAGLVIDDQSSSPTVAPDGSVLYGAYTRYNYAQGHLMRFDANGNYLGAYGFGWDYTPAIYRHDGTWSIVIKNNHYGDLGSYCNDTSLCPGDRTSSNPESPEEYLISQLSPNMTVEWSFRNTNTQSCTRNPDGSLSCVADHPDGFEWCVNAPAIDANGVVYANSEDGNLYAIAQGGVLKQQIFQQLAIGASYTPASLGADGKIYSQNDGHLFVVGN